MRYRKLSDKRDILGQVFTPPALAKRLMILLGETGGDWLELGVGGGELMHACFSSAHPKRFVGVEIDAQLLKLHRATPLLDLQRADVLNPVRLEQVLDQRKFEFSIGNPPFGEARLPSRAVSRLGELCPGLAFGPWARLDLYFVLESLSRVKRPGAAAFIVGSPLIDSPALKVFRKTLVEQANELECFELPLNTFDGAEVRSYLLIARFAQNSRPCKVTLGRLAGTSFELSKQMVITHRQAIGRMDLSFYEFADLHRTLTAKGAMTLRDIGGSVVRGSRSKLQFESMGIPNFHTTDFPSTESRISFRGACDDSFQLAGPGHILVPRVGSRCLDRQVMVSKGKRPYTEAVYRVNVPAAYRTRVFDWMRGSEGVNWRLMAAHGACAKHLTVATLLEMPIPI